MTTEHTASLVFAGASGPSPDGAICAGSAIATADAAARYPARIRSFGAPRSLESIVAA